MLAPSPRWRIAVAATLVLLASSETAVAAPGSNAIAGAAPLLFSVPGGGSTAGFTTEGGEPLGCPMVATAWWRIAGNGRTITLSTNGSTFDTVLAVYNQGTGAPANGNRIACNDDFDLGQTSQASFASQRGVSYLVQVGGSTGTGTVALTATSERAPNDDRANAQPLVTGIPTTGDNHGATSELDELLSCGTAPYAATTWYRWTAPAIGDAVFSASATFEDTVLTVYRDGAVVACNDDAGAPPGPSQVRARVAPGDYLLQIGHKGADGPGTLESPVTAGVTFAVDNDLDNDGELASTDCNDADPSIRHAVVDVPEDGIDQDCDGVDAINLDRDADGFPRPGDCNDADAKIHPLARDIPGNKLDEDCKDGPAPYPRLASTVRSFALFPPFRFTTLSVVNAVAGSRIELRCSGARCFARKAITVRKSSRFVSVLRYVKRARLRRGAVAQVRITKAGHVGFVRRITVRGGTRAPKIEDLCLPVGANKPKAC